MISWRYHLVSIVAVFLALGLGVLAGTTVLDQGLLNNLRDRTTKLEQDNGDLRSAVGNLQGEIGTLNTFSEQSLPFIVGTRLSGEQVVIVTQEGLDSATLSQIRRTLDLAGAQVLTTLSVRAEMAASTPASQKDLAGLLGKPVATPADQLTAAAAQLLAQRLSQEPKGNQQPATDPLGELLSAGFLTSSAPSLSDTTLSLIGGRGQLVVAVGGASVAPTPGAFLIPFVRDLVGLGVITGAGESAGPTSDFVVPLRSTVDPGQLPIVTVDDADQPMGGAALAIGLERAAAAGTGGNYGSKAGTSGLLPPPG